MHDSLPQSSLGFLARFLYRLGAFIARKKWVFLVVWLLAFVGAIGVLRLVGSNTSNNVRLPGTNSQKATDLLAAKFPPQQNGANPVLFYSKSGKVTAKKNKQAIQTSYKALKKLPHVYSVTSPFSQQRAGSGQQGQEDRLHFGPAQCRFVQPDGRDRPVGRQCCCPRKGGRHAGRRGGSVGSELSEPSTESSEVIGLVAAMIILAFTFGTLVAMGMPIISAVFGLAAGWV